MNLVSIIGRVKDIDTSSEYSGVQFTVSINSKDESQVYVVCRSSDSNVKKDLVVGDDVRISGRLAMSFLALYVECNDVVIY